MTVIINITGTSDKIGTIQRRLAWPLRKDDTHKSRNGIRASHRRGVDMRRCASKDARPQRGVDLGAVPHRLDKGTSASEDAGSRRGVDCDVPH